MKVAGYIEHTHDVLHHNGLQQLNIQSTLHSCLLPQFKPCSQCSYSHEISYKRSERAQSSGTFFIWWSLRRTGPGWQKANWKSTVDKDLNRRGSSGKKQRWQLLTDTDDVGLWSSVSVGCGMNQGQGQGSFSGSSTKSNRSLLCQATSYHFNYCFVKRVYE